MSTFRTLKIYIGSVILLDFQSIYMKTECASRYNKMQIWHAVWPNRSNEGERCHRGWCLCTSPDQKPLVTNHRTKKSVLIAAIAVSTEGLSLPMPDLLT